MPDIKSDINETLNQNTNAEYAISQKCRAILQPALLDIFTNSLYARASKVTAAYLPKSLKVKQNIEKAIYNVTLRFLFYDQYGQKLNTAELIEKGYIYKNPDNCKEINYLKCLLSMAGNEFIIRAIPSNKHLFIHIKTTEHTTKVLEATSEDFNKLSAKYQKTVVQPIEGIKKFQDNLRRKLQSIKLHLTDEIKELSIQYQKLEQEISKISQVCRLLQTFNDELLILHQSLNAIKQSTNIKNTKRIVLSILQTISDKLSPYLGIDMPSMPYITNPKLLEQQLLSINKKKHLIYQKLQTLYGAAESFDEKSSTSCLQDISCAKDEAYCAANEIAEKIFCTLYNEVLLKVFNLTDKENAILSLAFYENGKLLPPNILKTRGYIKETEETINYCKVILLVIQYAQYLVLEQDKTISQQTDEEQIEELLLKITIDGNPMDSQTLEHETSIQIREHFSKQLGNYLAEELQELQEIKEFLNFKQQQLNILQEELTQQSTPSKALRIDGKLPLANTTLLSQAV